METVVILSVVMLSYAEMLFANSGYKLQDNLAFGLRRQIGQQGRHAWPTDVPI